MDQIRSTMMQQETLFKEQVQALHRLYSVQRSAMQEIRKRIYAQPQFDQLQGPVLEGKASIQVHVPDHSYKEEPLSLSLHPFCTCEESRAHDSRTRVETSHGAQSKFVRDFDLEKIPEDCMDEIDLNSFKVCEVDAKKFDTITDKKHMLSNQESKFTVSSDSSRSTISTAHKKLEDYVGRFWFTKRNSPSGLQSGTLVSEIVGQNESSGDGRDGSRPSFSSTVSDPETKATESESCSDSKTNIDESSESIAAEILLSFVSRSQVNNLHCIDESVKWTRSISRRRTLRRRR